MSERLLALAEAVFKGCAANVGPLIGADLAVSGVELRAASERPSAAMAVMPVSCELEGHPLCETLLASPLDEIATLARRLLDDGHPDKVRAPSPDELDAIGEVLTLMSGALDAALRATIQPQMHARVLKWWRSDDPGENAWPQASFSLARGQLQIESAGTVELWLILPAQLERNAASAQGPPQRSRVLLVGLGAELRAVLETTFSQACLTVKSADPGDADLDEHVIEAHLIVLSSESAGALELCRRLRSSDLTWRVPIVLCHPQPTRSSVIEAVEHGASQVLALPSDANTMLRIVNEVWRAMGAA